MRVSSKLFGGSHVSHLVDNNDRDNFIKHFFNETKIQLPEKNISNSVGLNSGNINKLSSGAIALAIPEDLSCYIYFTKFQDKNRCFIICRKLDEGHRYPKVLVMNVDVKDDTIFNGTLFEATRVYSKGNRFFMLVNDCISMCGEDVRILKFLERLEKVCIFLSEKYTENFKKFPFRMQCVTPFDRVRLLEQRIANLPYKIKNITFVSQNSKGVKLLLPYDGK